MDIVDKATRSRMMAGIRDRNTKPEITIRRMLHKSGFRYRLHSPRMPGKPDLVFSRFNAVIFVHGCFWHGHENCLLFRIPRSRTEFWTRKIAENKIRDQQNIIKLQESGWRVGVVWECSTKGRSRVEPEVLAKSLTSFLVEDIAPFEEFRGAAVNNNST